MKTNSKVRFILAALIGLLWSATMSGQSGSSAFDLCSLLKSSQLEVFNRQVTCITDGDKTGIRFSKDPKDGVAWLNGVEFSNGTIEVDIKGKNIFQQSFVGVAFHVTSGKTLDVVYFRPFNFQVSDPEKKIHAVQYASHPDFTWQVLREKFKNKYENEVNPAPDGNGWFHVKIVVEYPKVTVFVNSNTQPSLTVDQLNDRKTGKVGLWVGNYSDGDFANLKIVNQ